MTTGYRCLLVALSLLLTVSGTLALGGRSEARTTGVTTSYVTGTVTDTQGRPVAGVLVRLAPVERETDFDEGTATAADGTYRTSITGTSQAIVQFVAPYGGDVVGEFYDAALDLESATPVNLPPSGTVTGIDATLEPTS
ncbi:carboxypeptidase-like regulatory domain-containing protein [Nocardioides sp. C4-1]|uniref:carboxypeptidase-like regulatory domain-containing protein n=1 Tax=Nocardioides sp. C4-1 TaxID=3151851 RepID=UPI003265C3D4